MGKHVFGVDVGGTSIKMGLFDESGSILDKWEIETRSADGGKEILPDIADAIIEALGRDDIARSDVEGIGVGVPGPALSDGTVPLCVNLGWRESVDVAKELERLTGIKTKVGNDANVAALGEAWKGAGAGVKNAVMVTLGTGVGGGIIIDGRIVHGVHGAGGEIGHINVNPDELIPCNCGRKGCLEQYASATGIARLTRDRLSKDDKASSLRNITITDITAKDLFDAFKAGDELAVEVGEQFGEILGRALANISNTVDPEMIVIGGGVSNAGDVLIPLIRKYFEKYTFASVATTMIRLATLGNDAGIYGCARLVLD